MALQSQGLPLNHPTESQPVLGAPGCALGRGGWISWICDTGLVIPAAASSDLPDVSPLGFIFINWPFKVCHPHADERKML